MIPLKLSVTEGGLTPKTDLTIKMLLWNWYIIHPKSPHYELRYERKENNFLSHTLGE